MEVPAVDRGCETDLQPCLGTWESTDRWEHFEDFLKGLGVSLEKYGTLRKTFHTFRKEGAYYYDEVSVPSVNYNESIRFQFGEVGYAEKFQNKMKYTFYEKRQEIHCDAELLELGTKYHDWCKVENGELVKTYEVGDVVARRWYTRVPSS